VEAIGTTQANRLGSVIAVAHLYNAVKQTGMLKDVRWSAMDEAIQIHVSQFIKGGPPSDAKGILKRFNLACLGMSVDMFSRGYRGSPPDFEKVWKKGKHAIHGSEISEILAS
jgi:hypothetical protein